MHPGIEQFAREVDGLADYPTTGTILETNALTSRASELTVQTIRRTVEPVELGGRTVGYRTVFEGFALGDHNVYLALLLDATPSVTNRDRSASDYVGTVGAVVLIYESQSALETALRGVTDADGFDVLTGLNSSGFNRAGRAQDGRRFVGRITSAGRSGEGTTRFPDGRTVTGLYIADELNGIAVEEGSDGSKVFGFWQGNQKTGEYVRIDPQDQTRSIVQFVSDELVASRPYDGSIVGDAWVWLSGLVPESEPDAVSLAGTETLRLIGNGTVLIENTDGDLYSGPLDSAIPVRATIAYADGGFYEGEVVDRVPNGAGRLTDPNGITLDGRFVDGRPDGAVARIDGDDIREVRYVDGRPVRAADDRSEPINPEAPLTFARFARDATRQHRQSVNSVRQERTDRALAIAETTLSLTMQAAEALTEAMEAYNAEVARQQAATSNTRVEAGSMPSGPARPRAWSRGVPQAAPGSQLSYLVEGAERYYDQYLAAHGRGDSAAAGELYRGHELTVRNAERLRDAQM